MDGFTIILQTFFVYFIIFLTLYSGGKKTAETGQFKYVVYAILFYAIIFGLRYGVGTDTNSYIEDYQYALMGIKNDMREEGFLWFQSIFVSNGLPCFLFLGTISFLQLFFIYYALRNDSQIFPYLAITFIFGCIWLSYANGIRQEMAFCIYFLAISFMNKKRFFEYFILIFIASLFHNSAIILFLTFPLLLVNIDFFPSRKVQYFLFVLAIVVGNMNVITELAGRIEEISSMLGYGIYFEDTYSDMLLKENKSYGIGYYILLLLSCITIYYSDILKKNIPTISRLYNFYFFGLLLKYAFISSPLIQRVNYYFYGFDFIIIAYMLYVLHIHDRRAFRLVVSIFIILFLGTLYRMFENDSAFFFIGQEDIYKQLTYKPF